MGGTGPPTPLGPGDDILESRGREPFVLILFGVTGLIEEGGTVDVPFTFGEFT